MPPEGSGMACGDDPGGHWVVRTVRRLPRGPDSAARAARRQGPGEAYLRDDIPCGSPLCADCPLPSGGCSLPAPGGDATHYLIPDADAAARFLEVLELPTVTGIIFLSSVLSKAGGERNQRRGKRLQAIYRDRRRNSILFDNLHCLATAPLSGAPDHLKASQLSDWMLLTAAALYAEHTRGQVPLVVLSESLSQRLPELRGAAAAAAAAPDGAPPSDSSSLDAGTRLLADAAEGGLSRGVHICSPEAYAEAWWGNNPKVLGLFESVLASQDGEGAPGAGGAGEGGAPQQQRGALYPPHLAPEALAEAGRRGRVAEGTLAVISVARHEAVVHLKGGEAAVKVVGRLAVNRSLHGDTVAVRLPSSGRLVAEGGALPDAEDDLDTFIESEEVDAAGNGAAAEAEESVGALQPPGTTGASVLAVLGRESKDLVCCLDAADAKAAAGPSGGSRQRAVLAVPMDRRMPKVRIRTRSLETLAGQRFVVRIDGWQLDSYYPSGHVVNLLGRMDDIKTETEAILVASGVRWEPFCSGAMAELPQIKSGSDWKMPPEEVARRRDLRGGPQFICSIDPPGCVDVDDALGVAPLPGGGWEVGVHIADVSYFVRQGGLLDGEAAARCTTVYLIDRRLDMLPALLSEDLCSLRGGVDRFAMSVIWTLDKDLEVTDVWFGRTIIRSSHQLAYHQAQDILDGKPAAPGDELPPGERQKVLKTVELLSSLAEKRKAGRTTDGALELASAELRFGVKEDGRPTTVASKAEIPMMGVVAEMMIMANAYVASRIVQSFPGAALLRRHPAPRAEDFEQVASICRSTGLDFDSSSNLALASSIRALEERIFLDPSIDPALASVCRSLLTRSMSEAKYFSTGESDGEDSKHYGLALLHYTHFTSPIRRYADVVVHRQLMAAVGAQAAVLNHGGLRDAAHVMNVRHRESKMAQKKCSELYLLLLLAQKPEVHRALVYGFRDEGRQLMLFVDAYQIKTSVWLCAADGTVRLPLREADEEQEAGSGTGALRGGARGTTSAADAAAGLQVVASLRGDAVGISDSAGNELYSFRHLKRVWVELRAAASSSHGPALQTRLLDENHPGVAAAIVAKCKGSARGGSGGGGHAAAARNSKQQHDGPGGRQAQQLALAGRCNPTTPSSGASLSRKVQPGGDGDPWGDNDNDSCADRQTAAGDEDGAARQGREEAVRRRIEAEGRRRMAGPFAQSRGDESVASLLSAMRSMSVGSNKAPQPSGDAIIGTSSAVLSRAALKPDSEELAALRGELLRLQARASWAKARLEETMSPVGGKTWMRRKERLEACRTDVELARRRLEEGLKNGGC